MIAVGYHLVSAINFFLLRNFLSDRKNDNQVIEDLCQRDIPPNSVI